MKLHGYRVTHRSKWLLLQEGILSREELLLFELYLDHMVFDKEKEDYGCFSMTQAEAASKLRYNGASSINRHHNRLLGLGFIQPTTKESTFKIYNHELYLPKNTLSNGCASEFAKQEQSLPTRELVNKLASNIHYAEPDIQPTERVIHFTESAIHSSEHTVAQHLKNQVSKELYSSFKVDSKVSHPSTTYTRQRWRQRILEEPALPSWEDKELIDETLRETRQ